MRAILFVILFSSFGAISQNLHPDLNFTEPWEKLEAPMDSAATVAELHKIKPTDWWAKWDDDEYGYEVNNVHFIDFDDDSLLDIVYNGKNPIGKEGATTAFFKYDGKKYHLVAKFNGAIRNITRMNGRKRMIRFIVYETPCCAQVHHRMRYFYFGGKFNYSPQDSTEWKKGDMYKSSYGEYNSPENGVNLFRQYVYMKNLHFPEVVSGMPVVMFNDSATMMQKPAPPISNEFKDLDNPEFIFLNQKKSENRVIAKLKPQIECIAIGYEITDGIPYFLVQVTEDQIGTNYLKGQGGPQLGWVSGKQVIKAISRDPMDSDD